MQAPMPGACLAESCATGATRQDQVNLVATSRTPLLGGTPTDGSDPPPFGAGAARAGVSDHTPPSLAEPAEQGVAGRAAP